MDKDNLATGIRNVKKQTVAKLDDNRLKGKSIRNCTPGCTPKDDRR